MILRGSTSARQGYTLLEVLLASAISVILLGALYVSFDLTLRQTNAGREVVEQGDLSRAIVNRVSSDLVLSLGPLQAKSGGGLPPEGATTTSSAGATSSETTSEPSTDAVTDVIPTDTSSLTLPEGSQAADISFSGGVFGTSNQLTLFISRVPVALTDNSGSLASGATDTRSDLRRVIYYLSTAGGLCRQERPWVTSDGVRNSAEPDRSDEDADLIAEEITDVYFEYFDGSGWAGEWSGSDTSSDGKTVVGPPRAIRMTITYLPLGQSTSKTIEHVIPIRAAMGLYQPPVTEEPVDPTNTTGN